MSSPEGTAFGRRYALAWLALLAGGATGCTAHHGSTAVRPSSAGPTSAATSSGPVTGAGPSTRVPSSGSPAPQRPDLATHISGETALLASYDATIRRYPALAGALAPIRVEHAAHLTGLRAASRTEPSAKAPAAAVPATPTAAKQALRTAEDAAAVRLAAAAATATGGAAALLGSVAASESAHATALGAPARFTRPAAVPTQGEAGAPEMHALDRVAAALFALDWGYDVVGGQIERSRASQVRAVQTRYRSWQRTLGAEITRRHGTVPAAEPSYRLPFPVTDPVSALRLAIALQDGLAAQWRFLLGSGTEPRIRAQAGTGLRESAVQSTLWRADAGGSLLPGPFPGA